MSSQFFKCVNDFVILAHVTSEVLIVTSGRMYVFGRLLEAPCIFLGKTPFVVAFEVAQRCQCFFPRSLFRECNIFKVELSAGIFMLVDEIGNLRRRHNGISDLHIPQLRELDVWSRRWCGKGRHRACDLGKQLGFLLCHERIGIYH